MTMSSAILDWIDKNTGVHLKLKSRLQHEERKGKEPRTRFRYSVSAGGEIRPLEMDGFHLKTGLGISTLGGNRSENLSAEETFQKFPFALDNAYVECGYEDWVTFSAGKLAGSPIKLSSNLIWDADLRPEGIVLGSNMKFGVFSLGLVSALYVLDEYSDSKDDPFMMAWQVQLGIETKRFSLSLSPSVFKFLNIEGNALEYPSGGDTNLKDGDGNLFYGIGALTGSLKMQFTLDSTFKKRVALFADTVWNFEAEKDNFGVLGGVKLELWIFKIEYMLWLIQQNAWTDSLTDSDRDNGGGTKNWGMEWILKANIIGPLWAGLDVYKIFPLGKDEKGEVLVQFDLWIEMEKN